MNRFSLIVALFGPICLSACSSFSAISLPSWIQGKPVVQVESDKAEKGDASDERLTIQDEVGIVEVQKVPFRSGVSSATVERMAKQFGCTGNAGAGLLTEKGPVEVYRMQCDNGTTFMAQCELRQCHPMR